MLIGVDVYTGTDRVKVVDIAVNTNRDDVCDDESGLTWAERDNLAREVAALKVKAYDFANKASQLTGVEEQLRILGEKRLEAVDALTIVKRQVQEATNAKEHALASTKTEKEQLMDDLDRMRREKRRLEKYVYDLKKGKESLCQEEEAARLDFRIANRRRTEAIELLQVTEEELKKFSDTKQELIEAQEMHDIVVREREKLTRTVEKEMIAFEKQRVEIQSMMEKLVSERDRLSQDVAELEGRRKREASLLSVIDSTKKRVEGDIRELKENIKVLLRDISTVTQRRSEMEAELGDAYLLKERIEPEMEDKEAQWVELCEKVGALESELAEYEKERKGILEEIAQLNDYRGKLETKVDVFTKEYEQANSILGDLHEEISMLEEERDALRKLPSVDFSQRKPSISLEHSPGQPYERSNSDNIEVKPVVAPTKRRARAK
ncbi:merozoite surface protein 3b, putative [Perkinsus marinus ATCC 50983]|uniref:Merozoite surface protein 3b, putative n=1 Tax=Perkinsus marinus (strain ATCC 50983 / TXsc) TaxID=423536 RepID=C5KQT2_PERM5|nr:merozoite surface protein 3b, putative [Perkinsus marinus ATCC 50983]EER13178.1 merozoite surface protein 3b, putative [Perkinsus marinus ATCC 50983]|eukprot:XP_002781383.1 merozoite surface protein 3b, putative [Perkinsus marinus ATCC 50983]